MRYVRSTLPVSPHVQRPGGPSTVGLGGLEPPTSSLSGKRSNRLSYRPSNITHGAPGPGLQIHRRRDHRGYRTANTTPNRRRTHPRTSRHPTTAAKQQGDPGNHRPSRPQRVHRPLTPPQHPGNKRRDQHPESPSHQRFSLRHWAFRPSRKRQRSRMLKGTRTATAERSQPWLPTTPATPPTSTGHQQQHRTPSARTSPSPHPQHSDTTHEHPDPRPAAHRDTRLRPGRHHQQGHLPGNLRAPQRRRSRPAAAPTSSWWASTPRWAPPTRSAGPRTPASAGTPPSAWCTPTRSMRCRSSAPPPPSPRRSAPRTRRAPPCWRTSPSPCWPPIRT